MTESRITALCLAACAVLGACQGEDMDKTAAGRAPDEVRRAGNRLRHEASLYLQQHAANPVDWYPWGEEALALARRTDRPIFLSSGYASCHWCHVMEHEVFEHDDVAAVLNRHFVCIKVDREENPAVDATYMEAVRLMTGGGGWPMSVFLTPDLEPFYGGTYIPHDQFLVLLERIREVWTTRRADIERQASDLARHVVAAPAIPAPAGLTVDHDLLSRAVTSAHEQFDREHGGLTAPMKFPVPVRWRFLLDWYRRTGDPEVRAMVERTLDAMAGGGLQDHVGGGFHRYTVDAHWTVPHFEKMLYDNAQLASLYLAAGAALDRPDLVAVGADVLTFLDREMCGAEGACYASLDADSGGEEGTYYVWTPAQITAVVGATDGPVLADLLGVTDAGNFEHGASVITRRADLEAVARRHGREPEAVAGLFQRHRAALYATRSQRTAPGLDRKIITAWNGLALSAFAHGWRATGRAEFRERAETIAAYLDRVHRTADGGVTRASNGGRPVGEGTLDDHALLACGLLDLYQISGRADHLDRARELLDIVAGRFAREEAAWFTTAEGGDAPLGRRVDLLDSVLPSGASATVDALISYGALTGHVAALDAAASQLERQAGLLDRAGLETAGWLHAALRLQGPLYDVVVAGQRNDPRTEAFYRSLAGDLSPQAVITPLDGDGPSQRLVSLAPVLRGKQASADGPVAYVCQRGLCKAPIESPEEARQLLDEVWFR